MPHYLALTCEALARLVYRAAANAPVTVTVELFRQGLHDTPRRLRETLQAQIDAVPAATYDAILLAYGLCGRATVGLVARHTPLVLPRAHDCITLYLGSRGRYQEQFDANPGTYWYSQDYLERREEGANTALGATVIENKEALRAKYVEKYGEDNADYLLEVMGEWQQHYNRAVFIDTGTVAPDHYEALARRQAEQQGWTFERLQGDARLINGLVYGDWTEAEFLIVPPGYTLHQNGGEGLIEARKAEAGDAAHG